MRDVTYDELSHHCSADDLWVAINGRAYDVTEWSKAHPGGQLVLVFLGGKDATEQFRAYHPSWVWQQLQKFQVGTMQGNSQTTKASRQV